MEAAQPQRRRLLLATHRHPGAAPLCMVNAVDRVGLVQLAVLREHANTPTLGTHSVFK